MKTIAAIPMETRIGDAPQNIPLAEQLATEVIDRGAENKQLSQESPAEFAKRVGAPVVQARQCETCEGQYRVVSGSESGLSYRTRFVGATRIVDAYRTVLAARSAAKELGIVFKRVHLGTVTPAADMDGNRFLSPELPLLIRRYWDHQNWVIKSVYARRGREFGLQLAQREVSR